MESRDEFAKKFSAAIDEIQRAEACAVFFNRPKRPIDLRQLYEDIASARKRLAIASAWFTHNDIAKSFLSSPATEKIFLMNGSDVKRNGGSKATKSIIEKSMPDYRLSLLGGESFEEGVMHHKFIVADDILWCGSFNFTYQALKNYEFLIRINNQELADQFYMEANSLADEHALWNGAIQFAYSGGAFRCGSCGNLYSNKELGLNHDTWMECIDCYKKHPIDRPDFIGLCQLCKRPIWNGDGWGSNTNGEYWCTSCSENENILGVPEF